MPFIMYVKEYQPAAPGTVTKTLVHGQVLVGHSLQKDNYHAAGDVGCAWVSMVRGIIHLNTIWARDHVGVMTLRA
jgi:hypothetical protein